MLSKSINIHSNFPYCFHIDFIQKYVLNHFLLFQRATPSKKYSSRTNAGDVIASIGNVDNAKWSGSGNKCTIKVHDPMENMSTEEKDSTKDLCQDFKYMFQKLTDKAAGTMIMEKSDNPS